MSAARRGTPHRFEAAPDASAATRQRFGNPAPAGQQVVGLGTLDLATNKREVTFRDLASGRDESVATTSPFQLGQVTQDIPRE
jgi:hypothetical protein